MVSKGLKVNSNNQMRMNEVSVFLSNANVIVHIVSLKSYTEKKECIF